MLGRVEPEIVDGSDFGRMRHSEHEVAHAGSAVELSQLLAKARSEGRHVTITGSRHSANGQTLPPDGGLQIRLDRSSGLWTPPKMVGETHVRVSGAHTWKRLQTYLRKRGLTAPVLTDHLTTTIGGTLSVGGGIGTSSVAYGRQLDSVRAFSMLLPAGELVQCSAHENSDLFRHAMGGFGELGVIDEVEMATRPYRPWMAMHRYQTSSMVEAVQHVRRVLLHPDVPTNLTHLVIEGPILNTDYVRFEIGFEYACREDAEADLESPPEALRDLETARKHINGRQLVDSEVANGRHDRSASYVGSLVDHRHLWNDFFFADFDAYVDFLRFAEREVFAKGGRRFLLTGLAFAYPAKTADPVDPSARRAAFSFPHRAPGSHWWSMGFNYSVPAGPEVAVTAAVLARLRKAATERGAGVYGYGYDERTEEDFRRAYGPIVDDFRAIKARVDPEGRFGGGLPVSRRRS